MSAKKTQKEFIEEVKLLHGNEYEVIGQYINAKKHIKIKHIKCGKMFEVMPTNFLKGTRCPHCFKSKKKTTEEFKNEVYKLVKDEYSVLGEYINSHTKIKIKHEKCGNVYEVRPTAFLYQNARCPKCSAIKAGNYTRKGTEKFKREVIELVGNKYTVLGEYINTDTKIKMKHNKCGHIYNVTPNNFLRGKRCPKCAIKYGVEAYNYKGTLTKDEREKKRLSLEHSLNLWRKKCLERDNYTCKICGNKNNLQVHHLDGYHWCKEKRYKKSNGITLCKECHAKFHSKFGFKGNTKQQFIKFITESE